MKSTIITDSNNKLVAIISDNEIIADDNYLIYTDLEDDQYYIKDKDGAPYLYIKMKYFFAVDVTGLRHVIVARSLERAKEIFNADVKPGHELDYIYELTYDAFKQEGFLISDPVKEEEVVEEPVEEIPMTPIEPPVEEEVPATPVDPVVPEEPVTPEEPEVPVEEPEVPVEPPIEEEIPSVPVEPVVPVEPPAEEVIDPGFSVEPPSVEVVPVTSSVKAY